MSAGYERGSSGRKIDSGGAKLNGMWDMNLFSCGGENETPKSLSKMFASDNVISSLGPSIRSCM